MGRWSCWEEEVVVLYWIVGVGDDVGCRWEKLAESRREKVTVSR
jgi:hypothetical protein